MLAQLGIPAQRRDCRRLHRYPSSLMVLGLADQDHTGVQVDIIAVEADGLAHPHAGHGHQPDKRVIVAAVSGRGRALPPKAAR